MFEVFYFRQSVKSVYNQENTHPGENLDVCFNFCFKLMLKRR